MKLVIFIYACVLGLGIFTMHYSQAVLNSVKPDYTVLQTDIGYSQGMTKLFPDYQVQRAASVQGTVGIE